MRAATLESIRDNALAELQTPMQTSGGESSQGSSAIRGRSVPVATPIAASDGRAPANLIVTDFNGSTAIRILHPLGVKKTGAGASQQHTQQNKHQNQQ